MRKSSLRIFSAAAALACLLSLAVAVPGNAQPAMPDVVRVKTPDGLSLWGTWFAGGKGQKSDSVILVHGYGSNTSDGKSGPWEPLAKALQKEGYSVLTFDLRGHGRSTDFKVFDDQNLFAKQTFNKLAGYGGNPAVLKNLKEFKHQNKFTAAYYPYLVNDLSGARRFIDEKSDANECNAGRVFVIGESSICPLVMLWLSTEWMRNGVGPAVRGAEAKSYVAGKDIAGAIFLGWTPATGGGSSTALGVAGRVMDKKILFSDTEKVGEMLREKVAMAFIYGNKDDNAAKEARRWFNLFGIPMAKKTDVEKVKYMVEVTGAEKLSGIKLLEITETRKEKAKDKDGKEIEVEVKGSVVEKQILDFMKATKDKGINGTPNGPKRYVDNYDPIPVPLHDLGNLALPK